MDGDAGRARFDARTGGLLDGPILSTLLRLGMPNVLAMLVQACVERRRPGFNVMRSRGGVS